MTVKTCLVAFLVGIYIQLCGAARASEWVTTTATEAIDSFRLRRRNEIMISQTGGIVPTMPISAAAIPGWAVPSAGDSGAISVIDFGADPTGMKDSSAAITSAIVAALNRSATISDGSVGRQIGNVVVSLESGQYRLDSPIVFPASGGGYVTLQDGALIAGPVFNSSEFLVDMSVGGYVYVSFLGIYFDSQHRGGNLKIASCLRTTVRNCYFSAFSLHGLLAARGASQGHELIVSESFFAEYEFGTKNYDNTTAKTGTALEMQFPDSIISNIVALCSRRGLVDSGGNQYSAVHVYTTCSSAKDYDPDYTTAALTMDVAAGVSRFESCYWDNAVVILQNPYVVSMTNGLFFGAARLILQADKPGTGVYGLVVTGNQFQCESNHCPDILIQSVPGTNGSFSSIQVVNSVVDDNWYGANAPARSTRVTGLVTMTNSTTASFNAGALLVFPGVGAGSAQYSLRMHSSSPNKFVRHSLGDWDDSDSFVTVQTDEPVDAAVYITIDQSTVVRQTA